MSEPLTAVLRGVLIKSLLKAENSHLSGHETGPGRFPRGATSIKKWDLRGPTSFPAFFHAASAEFCASRRAMIRSMRVSGDAEVGPPLGRFATGEIDAAPWWVAGDVARVLGYRDAPNMCRLLDEDEQLTHNVSSRSVNGVVQDRDVTIISESGLYHAILKSRRAEAKAFRKWVTAQVLPAIRR
ncbi:MAG: Bro-N domain-containing protein [Sphingobium sp.]|nr:Bro-N domain-containing protein [Sphingobium sp.]